MKVPPDENVGRKIVFKKCKYALEWLSEKEFQVSPYPRRDLQKGRKGDLR